MEDLPAYSGAGNPAHTGAKELAWCAEVGKPWPVALVTVRNWLEVAVQQRLRGWLEEPGWQFEEEWQIVRLVAH